MMIIITMVQITTIQNRNTNSCSTVYLAQVSEIFLNVKECSLHRYLTYFSTWKKAPCTGIWHISQRERRLLVQVSDIFLNVKEGSLHRYLTYFSTWKNAPCIGIWHISQRERRLLVQVSDIFLNVKEGSFYRYLTYFSTWKKAPCTGIWHISQRERRLFQQHTKGSRTWIMSDFLQCCFSNRGAHVCKIIKLYSHIFPLSGAAA